MTPFYQKDGLTHKPHRHRTSHKKLELQDIVVPKERKGSQSKVIHSHPTPITIEIQKCLLCHNANENFRKDYAQVQFKVMQATCRP